MPLGGYALGNDTDVINSLPGNDSVKIGEFIEKQIYKGKIPGMAVVIVQEDKIVYEKGFGYSDIEAKKLVTARSLFEIGSNSKAFTAFGIFTLKDKGLIKLEDEVTKYIPWLKVKYQDKEAAITIEELLHHTSGIPFKTIDKIPVSDENNALEQTVKTLIDIELDSMPGEKYQYATINYDVLGLIIEKVTGSEYEKYIEENVLKPMGLNNTYLSRNEAINEHIARGYKISFLKPRLYSAPVYRGNKPAGYIISCAADMAKWLMIQMGTSIDYKDSKGLVGTTHDPNRRVEPLRDGSSYAAGWFVYQKGSGEISHGGNNPNYSSYIIFRPEDKVGIAVLSNTNSQYVYSIALGINEILQGRDFNKDIRDLNQNADKIAILIICISGLTVVCTLFFIYKALRQIISKERKLYIIGMRSFWGCIFSLAFVMGLSYCIYLIPYALYRGVSWSFVFVWLPNSVKAALVSVYASIWLVYVYYLAINFYKKKDENPVFIVSLISIVSGFGNALIIFSINLAINSNSDSRVMLVIYFIVGIVLYVCGQKIVRERLIEITNNIVFSKRMEIVKCLLRTSYHKFEDLEKGIIESTLNNDTETISRFANSLITGLTSAITLIFCFIYLGFINLYVLLLSIAIISLISSIYYIAGRYANRVGEESRDLQNTFFKFVNDLIYGIKELIINEKGKNEFESDMENSCDKYRVKRGQAAKAFASMFVIGELLFTLAIGFIVFIFPFVLKNLEITNISSYVFILLYMTGPVHGILNTIPNAIEARISMKRIDNLVNQISLTDDHKENDFKQVYMGDKFSLRLNGVGYVYQKNDGQEFKVGPINYEFNSGEIVFITGGNGSGKSTVAKLLTGLYIPSGGYITLNGSKISERLLNQIYSAVFTDFYLFDKPYGIDYKDKEKEIQNYLRMLQLDSKVQIKDGRFSTTKLSTGQKKRLALLVSYLEDKPIFLFDEWAADQDPEFRLFFYDTLLPELKERGKCVIAITHDDRYFNIADKVIKMELGLICNA